SNWIKENGQIILNVEESHALIMAAGYLKHNNEDGIYFRGQRKIYDDLSPGLYRGIKNDSAKYGRETALYKKIDEFKSNCSLFSKFGDYAAEPILQHYGLNTTWIDIVDNIWVALWFACHEARCTKDGKFIHYQKRIPDENNKFAYIYLLAANLNPDRKKPGYWRGNETELIDLRVAAPSYFLRPHAQHGLLFRCIGKESGRPLSYASQIKGVVRIPLRKAFDWLGNGQTIGTHALFPPAYYDNGYKILLQSGVDFDAKAKYIGCINSVGT
ncbi:FRG domain-containing protein, partial [Comamonas aquatica]